MAIASNLYATRVFSEHPTALWALDDDVSYITLISDANKQFSAWTKTNATAPAQPIVVDAPLPEAPFSALEATDRTLVAEAVSPVLFNLNTLNQDMKNFSINFYIYSQNLVDYYEYGYKYTDPDTLLVVETVRRVEQPPINTWLRLGSTFDTVNKSATIQLVFRVFYPLSGSPYKSVMNGLSVGQWSEQTNAKSMGVTPADLDADIQVMLDPDYVIADPEIQGVPVVSYGVATNTGYAIVQNGRLLACNVGAPMVFGSENVTKLYPSDLNANPKLPSLILPGKGVLNEGGRYTNYTVEMWLRIDSIAQTGQRIWGPLTSTDGLYVKDGFLTLAVGNEIGSHFVADWYRPMLVHIIIKPSMAVLMINGDPVVSLSYNDEEITLPSRDNDWVGFYCHEEQTLFEVDSVSVFPYIVPVTVAKRRFVWGQGVESPETINSAYEGTTAYIDFPYANYTANKIFPDMARWDSGHQRNLFVDRNFISVPQYSLPSFEMGQKTLANLYEDNLAIQEVSHAEFMSFRPNATWTDQCYMIFDSLNVLNSAVRGFYGVFEVEGSVTGSQPLINFVNSQNGDTFKININGLTVTYILTKSGVASSSYKTFAVTADQHFVVGLDLPRMFDAFGGDIAEFFGNPEALQVMVGGDGETTFVGHIYRIGFCDDASLNTISTGDTGTGYFDSQGIARTVDSDNLNDVLVSYTLMPISEFDRFYWDIGVNCYWEEYFPLSFFASYVTDANGYAYYDLDFLQFNLGYPSGASTDLHSFITFQTLTSGANKQLTEFPYSQAAPANRVLDLNDYSNQYLTKFSIKDQTVIYPPRSRPIETVAVVVHLDINVRGVRTHPLIIRKLAFSSKSLSSDSFNSIGTRFGTPLFPYAKSGYYYDTTSRNPYSIYKDSNPYLYLTKYSGIQSLGGDVVGVERGIAMPINTEQLATYKVNSLQVWLRPDEEFSSTPQQFFNIRVGTTDLGFYVVADQSGYRGKMYCINNATGQDYTSINFYQDGVKVLTPYIHKDEWSIIGIALADSIDFTTLGHINLLQGAVYNNISFYRETSIQSVKSSSYRPWILVKTDQPDWEGWKYPDPVHPLEPGSWDNVMKLGELDIYSSDPSIFYRIYSGVNREIIDDSGTLDIDDAGISVYIGSGWTSYTVKPV